MSWKAPRIWKGLLRDASADDADGLCKECSTGRSKAMGTKSSRCGARDSHQNSQSTKIADWWMTASGPHDDKEKRMLGKRRPRATASASAKTGTSCAAEANDTFCWLFIALYLRDGTANTVFRNECSEVVRWICGWREW